MLQNADPKVSTHQEIFQKTGLIPKDALSLAVRTAPGIVPYPSPEITSSTQGGGLLSASGGDSPSASGGETTPSPGDASKFLSAKCFYQCQALLPGAQPCEKIFANLEDFEAHCISVHKISERALWKFWQVLHIDSHNNLYIL